MNPDLLVLGAGPAGIAISLLMAKKGYSAEILDPAFFPRAKICGEFLNPQAVHWLNEQNLCEELRKLNPFPIYGMKIGDAEGRSFTGYYAGYDRISGYAIQRKEFDTFLVNKARDAGILLHEGFKAERLLFNGDTVVGVCGVDSNGHRFEKRARVVIGADGRNNLIGRSFGWVKGIRNLRKYAFQAYFENVPALSNFGEMHLVSGGYLGIAPLDDSLANIALVVDEKAYPNGDANKEEFLLAKIQNSALGSRFDGLNPVTPVNSIGPLAFEMRRVSGHGTLLIGDTCGFIDPFTGEGINYAFTSATLASGILDASFRSNCFDDAVLALYDQARKATFRKRILLSKMLKRLIPRPGISALLVKRFAEDTDLANTIVSAVGSAAPVEQVLSLRFLTKVMGGRWWG